MIGEMSGVPLFPPALILIIGAFLIPYATGVVRSGLLLFVPLLALIYVLGLPEGEHIQVEFVGQDAQLLRVDAISRLFGVIFTLMGFLGMLFALRQEKTTELSAALLYSGCALGVVFSGDLLSLFVFWELMALGSGLILWSAGTPAAQRAAQRYLMVHFLGGVVLMIGVIWHLQEVGDISFTTISLDHPGAWLILAGFLGNAGAPPFGAWVGDAYPEASYTGTVFLSAYNTKTAV